jgi:hypothetical protein
MWCASTWLNNKKCEGKIRSKTLNDPPEKGAGKRR